jgi:hypothetical protein
LALPIIPHVACDPFSSPFQAAALYAQASDFNKTARFYYMKAEDAYFLANAQASFINLSSTQLLLNVN